MLQAILFDLDGTLLPMDNDYFTTAYFRLLAQTAARWGYHDPKLLTAAVWKGVEAMVRNDGSCSNYDRFWQCFAQVMGEDSLKDLDRFSSFYENEFHGAKAATEPAPLARTVVTAARQKAERVILATNPIFPRNGDETRLSWIDLSLDEFDLVTDYQNSTHCKPNPAYYRDILEQFNLDPARCLMVGNDVQEDMLAAKAAGIPVYLLDDHLINRENTPIDVPHGSYADLLNFLNAL